MLEDNIDIMPITKEELFTIMTDVLPEETMHIQIQEEVLAIEI